MEVLMALAPGVEGTVSLPAERHHLQEVVEEILRVVAIGDGRDEPELEIESFKYGPLA